MRYKTHAFSQFKFHSLGDIHVMSHKDNNETKRAFATPPVRHGRRLASTLAQSSCALSSSFRTRLGNFTCCGDAIPWFNTVRYLTNVCHVNRHQANPLTSLQLLLADRQTDQIFVEIFWLSISNPDIFPVSRPFNSVATCVSEHVHLHLHTRFK